MFIYPVSDNFSLKLLVGPVSTRTNACRCAECSIDITGRNDNTGGLDAFHLDGTILVR